MERVTLKNGSTEDLSLVVVVMTTLRDLLENQPIAFYELVMKCRDRNHVFFGNSIKQELAGRDIVSADGETIHDSIRNIVLSAVEGDDFAMTLGSPVEK